MEQLQFMVCDSMTFPGGKAFVRLVLHKKDGPEIRFFANDAENLKVLIKALLEGLQHIEKHNETL